MDFFFERCLKARAADVELDAREMKFLHVLHLPLLIVDSLPFCRDLVELYFVKAEHLCLLRLQLSTGRLRLQVLPVDGLTESIGCLLQSHDTISVPRAGRRHIAMHTLHPLSPKCLLANSPLYKIFKSPGTPGPSRFGLVQAAGGARRRKPAAERHETLRTGTPCAADMLKSLAAEGESSNGGYSSSSENDEIGSEGGEGASREGASSGPSALSQHPAKTDGPSAAASSPSRQEQVEMPQTGTGYPMIFPPPHHLWTCPPYPEPLNELKEGIVSLMTMHDNKRTLNPSAVLNRVVYDSIEPNPAAKSKSPLGPGEVRQYYDPTGPDDDTLIFESRFESGNLRRAIQIYPGEYDLILRPDINTRGHTQWYYFSVRHHLLNERACVRAHAHTRTHTRAHTYTHTPACWRLQGSCCGPAA